MTIVLVYYTTNTFAELIKLGKTLDKIVRHIVKNLLSEEIKPYVEDILPDIQCFLSNQRDLLPILILVRFNQ
jgi:hypothetical protein